MRSSKNRSRSKPNNRNNNNRSATNVVNRVFDSSGPESKVRGTPQQIIEKYNQLARDAQLSNDRVAAENFQQHAEHYTRLLGAAQKELDIQREQQEREQQERRDRQEAERIERAERAERNGERPERNEQRQERSDRPERTERNERSDRNDRRPRKDTDEQPRVVAVPGEGDQPDIAASIAVDTSDTTDSGLVATPEEETPKPKRARAPRKPRAPRAPKADATPTDDTVEVAPKAKKKPVAKVVQQPSGDTPEAAE
ncbi:DUF4167 domain-containing protein [Pacificibacter marinus]|uniref:DUF4167 domain-containing protein n=1 Tax=Pacificibacter marinus TaxID=658057 RepID=A0A1Y5RQ03_9RHOB|nr:DUF4167 domain-containing protein [Pacificibacter marinus]SEL31841.1 protein of unknown function [Pacificibacter marinus]SLN22643.1 hypothetical protein PAM7971_00698 [Pacificibacter marinus]